MTLQTTAILLLAGTVSCRADVKVDRENLRAEVQVQTVDGGVTVYLEPYTNLLIHTMNLYQLFDGRVADYPLRRDEASLRAVNPKILAELGGMDKRFSPKGKVQVFAPTMTNLVEGRLYLQLIDAAKLRAMAPAPFGEALAGMWTSFYKDYWRLRFDDLVEQFRAMDKNVRWAQTLGRMEKLTGRKWRGSMQVFAVEGTGKSAFTFGKNVCIGTLRPDDDAGFVHEGLHLLLQEEWSKSPRIAEVMAGAEFNDKFWGKSWASKYEQALVVMLSMHLQGRDTARGKPSRDEFLKLNLEGNMAGDIADIAIESVGTYLKAPDGDIERLMFEIVSKGEARRRTSQ